MIGPRFCVFTDQGKRCEGQKRNIGHVQDFVSHVQNCNLITFLGLLMKELIYLELWPWLVYGK